MEKKQYFVERSDSQKEPFPSEYAEVRILTGTSEGSFKHVLAIVGDKTVERVDIIFDVQCVEYNTFIILDDGTRILVIGGLTCGYSGTGPAYMSMLMKEIGIDGDDAEAVFDEKFHSGRLSFISR